MTTQRIALLLCLSVCGVGLTADPQPESAPEQFTGAKRLNNLVWELLNVPKQIINEDKAFTFKTWKSGWVYVSIRAKANAGRFSLSLDGHENIISFEKGENASKESMRFLPAGSHTLSLRADEPGSTIRLVVRAIPEILLHNFTDRPFGKFEKSHQDYLEKYVIPNVNTFVVPGAITREEHPYLPFFKKWRPSGRRWIGSYPALGTPDVGGDSYTVQQAYDYISTRRAVTSPLVDGAITDEFTGYDDVSYRNYGEAFRRLRATPAFSDRLLYGYVVTLYGSPHGQALARSIIDTGGVLAWERYLKTQPHKSAAQKYLQEVLISQASEYREHCPGSIEHMAVCFGFFSRPGGHMANLYPGVNHKAFLDMQFNLVANDPVFRDTRGLMGYHSEYSDEETLRWMCRLFRHYGIEGRTDPATSDPYVSPHLANGDFVDGLNGWIVDPAGQDSVTAIVKEGLGFLQARDEKPQGDTAVRTVRSAMRPNRISQELTNLEAGRLYSFRMMTGDFEDMSRKESPAVQIKLENVIHFPEKSFAHLFHNPTHRKHPPYDGDENKAWQTYHWHLFRARSDTATVTITDWAGDDEPGGPIGQQLVFNYVQVHPYFAKGERGRP